MPMNQTRNRIYTILQICLSTVLFVSCGQMAKVGYVTSTHNMPLTTQRYEGQISGAVGFNHREIQASFSPVKYLSLMGNYYSGPFRETRQSSEWGAGLYLPIKNRWVVETYLLQIDTKLRLNNLDFDIFLNPDQFATTESLKSYYSGKSIQLDFGYRFDEHEIFRHTLSSIGIGAKYSDVRFSDFEYGIWEYKNWNQPNQELLSTERIYLEKNHLKFLQISATIRWEKEPFRFLVQYSQHLSLSGYGPSETNPPFYQPAWLTMSLEVFLPRKWWR